MPRRPSENPEPLLIDRAAAVELPSAENIREWALDKRVFISSVMSELAAERLAVAASIRKEGLTAVMFEQFGGRDADPQDAYLAEVDSADIFIGILGRTYGKPLKTRFSATHTEYLHAEKASKNNAELNSGKRSYRLPPTVGAFIISCPRPRTCSRNQSCTGSLSSRWCHIKS